MQLTPFGLCVRKLRLETGCRLKDMADSIGCSSAYLSAVEIGKKPISDDVIEGAIEFFKELKVAGAEKIIRDEAAKTRTTLDVNTLSHDERGVLAAFARRMPSSNQEKRSEILSKLNELLNED